jgi:homoserine kinase
VLSRFCVGTFPSVTMTVGLMARGISGSGPYSLHFVVSAQNSAHSHIKRKFKQMSNCNCMDLTLRGFQVSLVQYS